MAVPAVGQLVRRKAEVQRQRNRQTNAQAEPYGEWHIAIGLARFTCQIHGGAKSEQAGQNSATTND